MPGFCFDGALTFLERVGTRILMIPRWWFNGGYIAPGPRAPDCLDYTWSGSALQGRPQSHNSKIPRGSETQYWVHSVTPGMLATAARLRGISE